MSQPGSGAQTHPVQRDAIPVTLMLNPRHTADRAWLSGITRAVAVAVAIVIP